MNRKEFVSVSIITPFRDNHEELIQLKSSLDQQTYPGQNIEIIFIDNGSVRQFTFPDHFFGNIILINENDNLQSPYSARNRGIEAANGDVIVFIDANSRPRANWIEKGLICMRESGSDITAGDVQFELGATPSASNIVDALTSLNMQKAVHDRKVAYTANLFVRKEVFKKIGLFEEKSRSGGDVRWTLKATERGHQITYCEDAVVFKYPRTLRALIKKKIRTGRGYFYTWRNEKDKPIWFYNFFRSLKPPSLKKWDKNSDRGRMLDKGNKLKIWLLLYIIGIAEQLSFTTEYLRYNLGKQRDIDRRQQLIKDSEENNH